MAPLASLWHTSIALVLWLVPYLGWCVRGTPIRLNDLLQTAWRPLLGGMLASSVSFVAVHNVSQPLGRLVLGGILMCCTYLAIAWFVFRQKDFYLSLARDLRLIFRAS